MEVNVKSYIVNLNTKILKELRVLGVRRSETMKDTGYGDSEERESKFLETTKDQNVSYSKRNDKKN